MNILLVVINCYYGYGWIFYWWILVIINFIILVAIGGYFINDYWWLFHCKQLVVI